MTNCSNHRRYLPWNVRKNYRNAHNITLLFIKLDPINIAKIDQLKSLHYAFWLRNRREITLMGVFSKDDSSVRRVKQGINCG